jgi:hypothetical protein
MRGSQSVSVSAAVALFVAAAANAAGAVHVDRTPPVFAGLASATTCIPGPVGGNRTSSFHLKWTPAKDAVTPASRIVYDVYQANAPGKENFAVPTYSTRRGVTTFATPPLSSTATHYFVVRARDAAGNRDRNRRERQGMNLCV